ncbi:hypothetical protein F2Q68_00005237 [Brassica cretica]|uniref:Uncharacterized protein n=2 Tax=Brassica cretica TaxID=69181 RepID=A0A8S9J7B0_BRACR|nr:hypothetical protein F2Q68_00005237 [Brassica cretica]KAF3551106.1 hypothetical protein DY000_02008011 [Brassica cretica]
MELEEDTQGKVVDKVKRFGDQLRMSEPWEARSLREGLKTKENNLSCIKVEGVKNHKSVWRPKKLKEDIKGEYTEKHIKTKLSKK